MTHDSHLWHVTVTVGGDPQDPSKTHAALVRLLREQPFTHSVRYGETLAELRYWEESVDMVDAASLALRLWTEHRTSADLPEWKVIGLEVVDKDTYQLREGAQAPLDLDEVTPMRF